MAACMKFGSGRPGMSTKKLKGSRRKKGSHDFRNAASSPRALITHREIRVAMKTT
jgi:hypothetical protein